MYANTKTWNPFKGCRFDCVYCTPSFQRQAKRLKKRCDECYKFSPHAHPERLTSSAIPSGVDTVFVAGNGDLAFAGKTAIPALCAVIREKNKTRPNITYYFQSKQPVCFAPYLSQLPANVVLVTTLETNRDHGYRSISKAPPPSVRHQQLKDLDYARKVITIEPVMAFDLEPFVSMIKQIQPEYVWLGFNTRPASVRLPEPSAAELEAFVDCLEQSGIDVRGKDLRGLVLDDEARSHVAPPSAPVSKRTPEGQRSKGRTAICVGA